MPKQFKRVSCKHLKKFNYIRISEIKTVSKMTKYNIINNIFNTINPYHWITWLRNRAFDNGILTSCNFTIPIICVGNITVGGTGKTPHTEYLINLLHDKYRIAVLSRGYGRKSKGYIKADSNSAMETIGDEPYQIKNKFRDITIAVDEKRVHGIEQLLNEDNAPDIILLDDAFQHRYVKAGLNILLIDSNRPIWKDRVLPFGRLRESMTRVKRADIIIFTKCNADMNAEQMEHFKRMSGMKERIPIFFSTMKYGNPYPLLTNAVKEDLRFKDTEVLLLTGIANPKPLKKELEKRGANVKLLQYADHHNFSTEELNDIANKFNNTKSKNKIIITTEKDATRLTAQKALPLVIKEHTYILPIEVDFLNEEKNMFNQIISDYVRKD